MHFLYDIDIDPAHSVVRVTVLEENVSLKCAEDIYRDLSELAAKGGCAYAAIYDLSTAKGTTISTDMVRNFARYKYPIPGGKARVVVGREPAIHRLAPLFQIREYEVVHTLEEAYKIFGVRDEDFTPWFGTPRRICFGSS
jgi:hypothetical protein